MTTQNSLLVATKFREETTHDTELHQRIRGAVVLHVKQLFIDAPGNPNKEMMARQLNENHKYAGDRILHSLALDPEMLGHATMTDEQLIAKVVAVIDEHMESGFWPGRK
jgi:hypothetical protein